MPRAAAIVWVALLGLVISLATSNAQAEPLPRGTGALSCSLAAVEQRPGTTSPDLLPILDRLAQRHFKKAELDDAVALRRRALKIAVAAFGSGSAAAAEAMTALALLYIELERYLDAEPLLIAAGNALGAGTPALASVLTGRSAIALARGDREGALDWAEQAVAIADKNEMKQQGGPLRTLGAALAAVERYRESEEVLRRAVVLDRAGEGEDALAAARSLAQLGNLYLRQKRFADALPPLEEAAGIDQSRLGPTHPRIIGDFYGIGVADLETGRVDTAAKVFRYAIGLADRSAARGAPSAAYLRLALARAEHRLGRKDQAQTLFAEARRILATAWDDERQRERRS